MSFFTKKTAKPTGSSDFSVFIREACAGDKKKVYRRVINEAINSQDRVIKSADSGRTK